MAIEEAAVIREEAQTAFSRLLLSRVRHDKHPSKAHIEILEQTLPPSLYRDYINVLFEKVLSDSHPSIPMLRHISQLIQRL